MAAKTPPKPGLIRNDPLANRPSPMKSFLRTLPMWLASACINALLIAIFLFVVDGDDASGKDKKDDIEPVTEFIEEQEETFDFENIEIGDDPEREINFDMKRIEDVSVPGPEDPAEAVGIDNAPPAPPDNIPPPPGADNGQGGAPTLDAGAALRQSDLSGGYVGNFKARPGGFAGRSGATRKRMVIEGGGNSESEAAVARGLRWLAYHQGKARLKNGGIGGYWSLDKFPQHARPPFLPGRATGTGRTGNDVAGTAFGMLPFLAGGMTHKTGKWQKEIGHAAVWLIDKQNQKDGSYDRNMYAHGLAAIAMAELYGLTGDPLVKRSAQAAINFIVYAQDPASGGWRYAPRKGGDTSVVGWQLMALKSAQMSGLNVPKETLLACDRWMDSCETNGALEITRGPGSSGTTGPKGMFGYTGPGARPTMSAVGLLCRQYLGARRDHPSLLNGVSYLSALYTTTKVDNSYLSGVLPQLKNVGATKARQAKDLKAAYQVSPMRQHYGNMYFLYYATQVMHHMNNEFWDDWNLGIWVDPDGKQVRADHLLRWDEDGDGLSKEELMAGAEGDADIEKFLAAEFDRVKRADKNGDGKLTEDELKSKDFVTWIPGMRETMIYHQDKNPQSPHFGSWDPRGDRHSTAGGRIMKTSLCLLTLEVYYRHLPLYRRDITTGKGMKKE